MLTREEALKKAKRMSYGWNKPGEVELVPLKDVNKLIREIYSTKPYKFEELHEGMWVWDDVEKKCNKIININTVKLLLPTSNSDKKIGFYYITENPLRYIVEFEDGRFYPLTKALQYQGKEDE